MRALLDTGVWFRRYHRLPMSAALRQYLNEVTEFYLSPLSVAEISYKWQRGKLPQVPDPQTWVSRRSGSKHRGVRRGRMPKKF
jgi:PIN domain nuclease of toxin-antitoxin system